MTGKTMVNVSIKNNLFKLFLILIGSFLSVTTLHANSKEVLIIDKGVSDYQFFIDNANDKTDIILLEKDADGLKRLASALKGYKNIEALHIISHGNSGEVYLGNNTLSTNTLQNYTTQLKTIKDALSKDGDILFYGCNVAKGENGNTFINQLSSLTGADVAASDNLTGALALNGDWVLEVQKGFIETEITMSKLAQTSFSGVLANTTLNFDGLGAFTNPQSYGGFDWTGFNYSATTGVGTSDEIILASSAAVSTIVSTSGPFSPKTIATYNWLGSGNVVTFIGYVAGVEVTRSDYTLTLNDPNPGTLFTFPAAFSNIDRLDIDPRTGGNSVAGFDNFTFILPNTAPTATNRTQTVNFTEDTTTAIADIVTADVDGDNLTATITMAAGNSTLGSLSTISGGTYTSGTGVWTITDTVANVNTALAAMQFVPVSNVTTSTTASVSISDGTAGALTGTITFTGTAVNDAPTATNLSAAEAFTEDASAFSLTDIVITDIDSANVTATLTLSDTTAGAISTATSNAVTSTYTAGTGVWSASGALADVNTLLAGATFTAATNYDQNFTIATSVDDGVATAITGSKAVTVTAVNDAPTATNRTQTVNFTEDTTTAIADIVTADANGDNLTATITMAAGNSTLGSLSAPSGGTYTSGTGVWTITDTVANVNTALAAMQFVPVSNVTTSTTASVSISDGTAGALTGTITFTGTAVNDTGVATITGTTTEGQVLTAGISDADGTTGSTFSYQWNRGGVAITGATATASTYTLVGLDVGTTITVTIGYTDDQTTVESVTSSATAAIAANPNTLGAVTIAGSTTVGSVLTSDVTDADGISNPIAYQWKRDGGNIAGATLSTYTLALEDVGTDITVTASYTDDGTTAEVVTSNALTAALRDSSFVVAKALTNAEFKMALSTFGYPTIAVQSRVNKYKSRLQFSNDTEESGFTYTRNGPQLISKNSITRGRAGVTLVPDIFAARASVDGDQPVHIAELGESLQTNKSTNDANKYLGLLINAARSVSADGVLSFNLNALNNTGSRGVGDLEFWADGTISVGKDKESGVDIDFSSDGITLGVDKRVSEELLLGMSVGFDEGESDIGSDGTEISSTGRSVAGYSSFQIMPKVFIDGMLGYGKVKLDSKRYIAPTNDFSYAKRTGRGWFGSISVGYEHSTETSRISPYARYDYKAIRLNSVTETGGGAFALTYGGQAARMQKLSMGIRAETQYKVNSIQFLPRVTLEYQHNIEKYGRGSIDYADIAVPRYSLASESNNDNSLLVGFGSGLIWKNGVAMDFNYQLLRSSGNARSQALSFQISKGF